MMPYRRIEDHPLLDSLLRSLDLKGDPPKVTWGSPDATGGTPGRLLVLGDAPVKSIRPEGGRIYGVTADSCAGLEDAGDRSDLVTSLNRGAPVGWMKSGAQDPSAVKSLMERFCKVKASRFNWYPGDYRKSGRPDAPGILVVSPMEGEPTNGGSVGDSGMLDRMVRDALDECPGSRVYIRGASDPRSEHGVARSSNDSRVGFLPQDLSPAACFEFCRDVRVAASPLGIEALIHGCRVTTYGWSHYSGWGLTEDRCQTGMPLRERTVDLQRLFEAAYLQYPHYFDPDSLEPCGLERILEHLEIQQAVWEEDAGVRITVGWKPMKRSLAEDYTNGPGTRVLHTATMEDSASIVAAEPDAKWLVWGANPAPPDPAVPVIRIEDGFLRSSGLGAMFHRPLSWVFDDVGIYFDSRSSSRLERILQAGGFSDTELADATRLMAFLREHRLTKYNLNDKGIDWNRDASHGRKVILVPGQVEADASIACGSPVVRTNGDLLRRVRENEPDAFLIYKAHPDLVAGARHGRVLPDRADQFADLIVTSGNVLDWLEECDEVHTMTSTVGFEALIRQVPVTTYGLPFYAAWGLTVDRLECPRRTRRLTLEELVCGALIRYPRYLNPDTGEFTTALKAAEILTSSAAAGDRRPWHLKAVSTLKRIWVEMAR